MAGYNQSGHFSAMRGGIFFTMFFRSIGAPGFAVLLTLSATSASIVSAQFGPPPGPPPLPRAAAPVDLTGYWVSLVTEDWRSRMTMPPKGDAESVPLNPEGRKDAMAWNPEKDRAWAEGCRG